MKPATLILMLSAIASLLYLGETRADMVYAIVNDPVDQNGWTISGTITTDGTLGSDVALHITQANVTISNGATVLQSSMGPWSPAGWSGSGLIATPTALEVAYGPEIGASYFYMDGGQFDSDSIGWFNEYPSATSFSAQVNIHEALTPEYLWDTNAPTGFGPVGSTWVIASVVPEPSSFILLGLVAAVGFCSWRLTRRKEVAVLNDA
jgi:PEP-CTERM motif